MFTQAAEGGSAEAQYQLGLMTSDGVGGPRDDVAARAWFEKAAAQGHAGALERMGAFAQSGRGGPQDANAAKAYYEKAAALGNEDAKAALAARAMSLGDQGQAGTRGDRIFASSDPLRSAPRRPRPRLP